MPLSNTVWGYMVCANSYSGGKKAVGLIKLWSKGYGVKKTLRDLNMAGPGQSNYWRTAELDVNLDRS